MKAAIYHGKGDGSILDKPTPVCGPKDVLLKTICARSVGRMWPCTDMDLAPDTGSRPEASLDMRPCAGSPP